ncbi:hypothetical protein ACFQZT_20795 [Paenibacillus sp. GCM10027628]
MMNKWVVMDGQQAGLFIIALSFYMLYGSEFMAKLLTIGEKKQPFLGNYV